MNATISLKRAVLIGLGLALLLLQGLALTAPVQAQTPRPTVDNGGDQNGGDGGDQNGGDSSDNGGSSDSSSDSATPLPPKTGVYGFVYNYSTAAYEGGVRVIAAGQGWQAETVTDSNGYYHLRELGFGKATLNLALPPGASAAAPNWPIQLVEETGHQQDLGFYWGEPDVIPVRLSGRLVDGRLVVQLSNETDEPATGGQVEIVTPASLTIAPRLETSQGQVAGYAAHRTQVAPGDIQAGETAVITAPLSAAQADAPAGAAVRLLFTYREQIAPQAIELTPDQTSLAAEFVPPPAAAPQPEPPRAAPAPAAEAQAQPTEQAAGQTAAATPPAAETNGLLPETGAESPAVNGGVAALTLVILAALGVGGWQSLRRRRG